MLSEIVLLTGATGFIGSKLVERLSQKYTIVALDRPGPPEPPAPAEVVDFDLTSEEQVNAALEEVRSRFGNRIASVIHLAAYYDISGEPNPLYEKVTVEGTRRLINGLQSFEVAQFVFASTMLVHKAKQRPGLLIDENSPIDPGWAYPQSKVRAEALLHDLRDNIPVVYLRIAGVYDDIGHSPFVAEQIARIYEHRLVAHFYPGMLCAGQSFVHVEDLADAVSHVVERRTELPAELPILVGEPDVLGYEEAQDIIGEGLHGQDWRTLRIPNPLAKVGAWAQTKLLGDEDFIRPWMVEQANAHYALDVSRARDLLSWQPKHNLRETLPRMTAALQRDPLKWYEANGLNSSLVAWDCPDPVVVEEAANRSAQSHPHQAAEQAEAEDEQAAEGGQGSMTDHGQMAMMEADERRTRWAHYANIGLGLWLAASPLIYDSVTTETVGAAVRAVTEDRGLPSVEWRAGILMASDVISGLLIAIFGALSIWKRTAWFSQWAVAVVGLWLLFAPILFWSPSAAQFQNDLLAGALAIAFSVLVPMMPGMSMAGMMDTKVIPPGWTYCPSTGAQRLPIAALGLIGLLISRMLTAYQLGHVEYAWEPFFLGSLTDTRNGTEEIITSDISKAWPIPDAGLGAISYMIEILMAVMGNRARWRTMPWMVTFFGILVVPLGVISIYFIIIQPIMIGTWSTPALIAALAMLVMIPFALDELIAMGQFLVWSHRQGKPLIRTFLKGDAVHRGEEDDADNLVSPATIWRDTIRGVTLPWTLAAAMGIGIFLMFSRVVLANSGTMAGSDHVVGAMVVTVAIIATAEVVRVLRLLIIPFGLWLIIAPWVLSGASAAGTWVSMVLGLLLVALSLRRGKRSREHYASWDRYIL